MPISISDPKAEIVKQALALGFDAARVTRAEAGPMQGEGLSAFLAAGHHGDMDWMEARAAWRADPGALWPQAKSAIMLAMNYGPQGDPLAVLAQADRGAISAYAQGDDYHDVVKKKLKALGGFIAQRFKADVKVFVDTAPVMEKAAWRRAPGWAGRASLHQSGQPRVRLMAVPGFRCSRPSNWSRTRRKTIIAGNCRACLDICPTNAFPAPYRLDARRCISYLTIENKGPIPREFREAIGNRIYGCDDCLAVCPWNKFAAAAREIGLQARAELSWRRRWPETGGAG